MKENQEHSRGEDNAGVLRAEHQQLLAFLKKKIEEKTVFVFAVILIWIFTSSRQISLEVSIFLHLNLLSFLTFHSLASELHFNPLLLFLSFAFSCRPLPNCKENQSAWWRFTVSSTKLERISLLLEWWWVVEFLEEEDRGERHFHLHHHCWGRYL